MSEDSSRSGPNAPDGEDRFDGGPIGGDDHHASDVDSVDDDWTAPLGTGGEDGDRTAGDVTDRRDGEPDGDEADPYAPEPNSAPVEPGAPSLENAAFVLLGALAMVAVLLRMVSLGFG